MPSAGVEQPVNMHHRTNDDHDVVAQEAVTANKNEQSMGLLKSLKLYRKACLWSIFLSTCVIMEGFDVVLLNALYAYPPFQRDFGERQPDGSYELAADWQSGLSGGNQAGQIIGLLLTGLIADRLGYRKTLIGALVFCTGFIFIVFFSKSLVQLLIGEILIAIPWGVFQTTTATYASEVCPTHLRAYLTTYINACWVLGQLIASGVLRSMLSRDDVWGYKIPFTLQWMWPVPLIVGIFFAPESPWWLVRHDRIDEAKRSLHRLTTKHEEISFNANETISMIIHTNKAEKDAQEGMSHMDMFRGTNLRRTEVVCVTWMIQAATGSTITSYSTYFYQQAGMAVENSFNMSLGQYGMGLLGTIAAWFMMNWFGRRTIYLYGQIILGIVLLIIGCVGTVGRENFAAQWTIGSLLIVHTFLYDCTVGPICYSLVSELSSTRLRTKSVALARNLYNCVCIITSVITPRMLNPTAWNWGAKTGFFWAGSCMLCAIWTYFRLPEPKGRTYLELDLLFEQGVSARKFSTTVLQTLDGTVDQISVLGKVNSGLDEDRKD